MHRFSTIASAISLLLFVVCVALAIVSFDRSVSYLLVDSENETIKAVYLDEYSVGFFRDRNDYVDRETGVRKLLPPTPLAYTPGWNRGVPQATFKPNEQHTSLGISWAKSTTKTDDDETTSRIITIRKVQAPLLLLIVLFGFLPANWLVRYRRVLQAQRRSEGRCLNCGYDLKGNTSGVCPECGTSV